MLDGKALRGDFEGAAARIGRRGGEFGMQGFLGLDERRRGLIGEVEGLKAAQNAASKKVPEMRAAGADATAVLAEMKELAGRVRELESALKDVEGELAELLMNLPNLPSDNTPDGADADENVEIRRAGQVPAFDFAPLPHWEIGRALGILDPEAAGRVVGSRFHFLVGAGARLERALMNFMLDLHIGEHGYTEIAPPLMAHRRSMTGTGQLPKFEEDAFKIEGSEYFLIPTAEVPLTNFHRESILAAEQLPISYTGYAPSFRAEAGAAGRDTRGLIRQHQFGKVELVKFTTPETSYAELEKLTAHAEEVLRRLGLPYRVVQLCAGDLGFAAAMTYDLEVYMPSYERFVEISSCTNFEDFQARRADIRYRADGEKPRFVHTLNGSGLATGRTVAAILENFQRADGSVAIPEALRPYMGSMAEIVKKGAN